MHIVTLKLINWGPYGGTHELALGPGVYAVVGCHEDDPARSNWVGKTWLLSAIRFALYGTKPESCAKEDDYITHGCEDSKVFLLLSDSTEITRYRKRTKSTQLRVMLPGLASVIKPAAQKAAQKVLNDHLLMDRDDHDASVWIGQKQISDLITMNAGPRQALVDGWFQLAPLRAAESYAMTKVREAARAARTTRAVCASLEPPDGAPDQPDLDVLEGDVGSCDADLKAQQRLAEAHRTWQAHRDLAGEYDRIVVEGVALKEEHEGIELPDIEGVDEELKVAHGAHHAAGARRARLAGHVDGLTDGVCPLSQAPCPVASDVDATCLTRRGELKLAKATEDRRRADWELAGSNSRIAERHIREAGDREKRLDRLRSDLEVVEQGSDHLDKHPDPPPLADVQMANAALINARSLLAVGKQTARLESDRVKRQEDLHDESEGHEANSRTWQAAARILRGARREIAERGLLGIETGANSVIADSGIDLTMKLQWEHEGNVLAPACVECGETISGQKHKECPACGADRGKMMIEELIPILSNRSGAADDIAGLAMQLAAAAYLRSKRESEWGVVCIDEPFGSLDLANRNRLAGSLQSMLTGRYAFEQAFVVAHDARIMEALPKRILITSNGTHSHLEVQL